MKNQNGFTILELLIATTVVSVILLLVSIMSISIGNLFHKGIYQSRVQENVRKLTDEIAVEIKNTSVTPVNTLPSASGGLIHRLCIGDTQYTYIIGYQLGDNASQSKHVLWKDKLSGSCNQPGASDLSIDPPSTGGTDGVELLSAGMRLTSFTVGSASTPSAYSISIGVAFGDDDLLCSPSSASTTCALPNTSISMPERSNDDLTCKESSGSSFCSRASLRTLVVQRVH